MSNTLGGGYYSKSEVDTKLGDFSNQGQISIGSNSGINLTTDTTSGQVSIDANSSGIMMSFPFDLEITGNQYITTPTGMLIGRSGSTSGYVTVYNRTAQRIYTIFIAGTNTLIARIASTDEHIFSTGNSGLPYLMVWGNY